MTSSEYIARLLELRTMTNGSQVVTQRHIREALKAAYNEIVAILSLKKPDTLTHSYYLGRKIAVEDALHQLSLDLNSLTRFGMRSSTNRIAEVYAGLAAQYAGNPAIIRAMQGAFSTVPFAAVNNEIARIYPDGRNFSQRLWRLDRVAKRGVDQIISKGLITGQSAVDMSKELRRYLVDPSLKPGVIWTTAATRSVTGRGTIHYNALRLASTEINNAYRESMIMLNKSNPITFAVKWHVSASHPRPDICDVWADSDLYGFGPGVYPSAATPIDHPGGFCFITDVLRPAAQWGQPKLEPSIRLHARSSILAPLAAKKGVTPGMLNSAWSVYGKTQSMISKVYKKAA